MTIKKIDEVYCKGVKYKRQQETGHDPITSPKVVRASPPASLNPSKWPCLAILLKTWPPIDSVNRQPKYRFSRSVPMPSVVASPFTKSRAIASVPAPASVAGRGSKKVRSNRLPEMLNGENLTPIHLRTCCRRQTR
jgi:hypothetical protein